jgi:hypothetical protein
MHARVTALVVILGVVAGLAAGCMDPASYAVRMAYLEKMASEGVQTHRLIVSQGGTTTAKRCTAAYGGLQDQSPPDDTGTGAPSQPWLNQIQAFFVQSCVTGLPKVVPGQSVKSPSTVSPQPSVAPSHSSGHPTTTSP